MEGHDYAVGGAEDGDAEVGRVKLLHLYPEVAPG